MEIVEDQLRTYETDALRLEYGLINPPIDCIDRGSRITVTLVRKDQAMICCTECDKWIRENQCIQCIACESKPYCCKECFGSKHVHGNG